MKPPNIGLSLKPGPSQSVLKCLPLELLPEQSLPAWVGHLSLDLFPSKLLSVPYFLK